jgi:DNA topoisomerase-1
VKHGKINATLPKGVEPESFTLEQAIPLLEARAQAKGVKRGGKAQKKASTKAAPANDDAALAEPKAPKIKAAASAKAKPPAKVEEPAGKAKPKAKTKAKAKSKPKGNTKAEPVASETDGE